MLIETKIRPPELRGVLIDRPALERQLDGAMDAKLAIVSAPAGFGKSTLLCQWLRTLKDRGVACGWLSLDAADNELGRFVDYIVAALQQADPEIARDIPALLRSSPVLPVESILTHLVNDLGRRQNKLVLVLDDSHVLAAPDISSFLDTLLTYAPASFHLVLTSRGQIPLKVANMRVRGQMIRIDEANMRFSLAETEAFLNRLRGLELSEADVISLQHRTEGWIAALQLASLSLRGRIDKASFIQRFSGTDRDVADFLVQDVLTRLPEDIIDFLLKTSILNRISAPLAQAVTGRTDAAQYLADIEQANLFLIPLDRDRTWYRYHHLFADFLQAVLGARNSDTIAGLHRKAAHWLKDNGNQSDAVHHALAAGDNEHAAALVESCCMPLIQQSHITRVSEWLNQLPDDLIAQRPRLQLAQVWVYFHMSRAVPAAAILKRARSSIRTAEQEGRLTAEEQRELRSELYALTAGVISAADRSKTAARLAQNWLTQFPEGQHFSRGTLGNILGFCLYSLGDLEGSQLACLKARDSHAQAQSVFGIIYSDLILGLSEQAAGNLRTAHDIYARAIQLARDALGPGSYAEAMVGIFEVDLLYEWNDIEGAEHLLQQHRQIIEECGLVVHEMACKLNVARLAACRGRDDEALAALEAAERQGLQTRYRRLFASALHERIRLLLRRGDVGTARLVLRGRGIDEAWLASAGAQRPASEPEHMAVARVLMAEERPEAALRILDRLADRLRRDGRLHRFAQVRALAAMAAHQSGDALSALAALVDAVSLCAPQSAVRSLLDEGAPLLDVLAFGRDRIPSWKTESVTGAFVEQLLAGRRRVGTPDGHMRQSFATPQLSAREADVARLLTSGQSNREMAQALAMAQDTVKWHLKNIFGKLSVSNRTQAVLRLQELGITQSPTAPTIVAMRAPPERVG